MVDIVAFIAQKEGFEPKAYRDPIGIWTIGYGTIDYPSGRKVADGDEVTEAGARQLLTRRVVSDEGKVRSYGASHGYSWNEDQIDALTSFIYNLGAGALGQVTANGTRSDKEILAKIPLYNKAGGRELAGLVTRRNEEAAIFASNGVEEKEVPRVPFGNASGSDVQVASNETPELTQKTAPTRKYAGLDSVANQLISGNFTQNLADGGYVGKEAKCFADGGFVGNDPINLADGGYVSYNQDGGAQRPVRVTHGNSTFTVDADNNVISDQGEVITSPTGMVRNILEKAGSGMTVEAGEANEGRQSRNREITLEELGAAIDFIPIIGDVKGLYESGAAWVKGNKLEAGLLFGAALIGLVPGAGDAFAAVIKAAVKIVAKVFAEIAKGLVAAVGKKTAGLMADEISDRAGRAAIEIVQSPSKQQDIIQKHIDELTAEAESRGYTVEQKPHALGGYAHDFKNKTINIPGGPWPVEGYLTALEEFNHSLGGIYSKLNEATGKGNHSKELAAEANAKMKAIQDAIGRGVEVKQSDLATISKQAREYVARSMSFRQYTWWPKVVANLPTDKAFWRLSGLSKPDPQKLLSKDETYMQRWLGTDFRKYDKVLHDGAIDGARPSKSRKVQATKADGTVVELEGTNAVDFIVEQTGLAKKTVQNKISNGNPLIASDGTSFSVAKDDGTFPEFKPDGRETTLGKIEGFDGNFADLMREHGIAPGSEEANNIRQRMTRGHEWNGYRRGDVEHGDVRADRMTGEATERSVKLAVERLTNRMDAIGLDSSNEALRESFSEKWRIDPGGTETNRWNAWVDWFQRNAPEALGPYRNAKAARDEVQRLVEKAYTVKPTSAGEGLIAR